MPKSVFQGIYESLKQGIESSVYQYQSMLMSEHDLCKQYSCSRSTVRRALGQLAQEGYVQSIQGKGVRVIWRSENETASTSEGNVLESFIEKAHRIGFQPSTQVLLFEHIKIDETLARTTGFSVNDRVVKTLRRRLGDGIPISTELSYVLEEKVPGLTEKAMETSLYGYIENELGKRIVTNKRHIVIEEATEADRELIGIPDSLPAVGVIRCQSFNTNGIMFEWSEERQHPYYFSYYDTLMRPSKAIANRG